MKSALTAKLDDIIVVDELKLAEAKTKAMAKVLKNLKVEGKAMLVLAQPDETIARASGNLENVFTNYVNTLNVYDILNAGKIVITKEATQSVEEVYA